MKLKRILIFIIALLLVLLPYVSSIAASGILLDGSFNDWEDKPSLVDKLGDETPSKDIATVKWFPDASEENLNFYVERLSGVDDNKPNKFEDWKLSVFLTGDLGVKRADITYYPSSRFVEVTLYDSYNRYLWSEKGKWGDDKDPGTRIEFMVPFQYIVSSIKSGYQISAYFQSGNDRSPDDGIISISTVSTFPVQTMFGVFIVCLVLFLLYKKRKSGTLD
jgi:hypothetical protein